MGSNYTYDPAYFTTRPTTIISMSPLTPNLISSSMANFTSPVTYQAIVFPKNVKDIRYLYYYGVPVVSVAMNCTIAYYSDSNSQYPKREIIIPMEPSKQSTTSFGSGSFTTTSTTQINRIIYGPGYRYTNSTTIPITDEV